MEIGLRIRKLRTQQNRAMEEHGMLPLSEKVKYLDIFVE